MNLIKNGDKYYLAKSGNDYYGIQGEDYTIINGKLLWANPNIYLQSSGTQYIDTRLNPDNTYSFEGKFLSTTTDRFLFGRRTSTTAVDAIMVNTSGSINVPTVYYNYGDSGFLTSSDSIIKYNQVFKVKIQEGKLYWNDKLIITSNKQLATSTNYNMWLFDVHQQNTINRPLYGKCYYFNTYKNNEIIQHLVPVPTGMVIGNFTVPSNGMFDIVNQQFYPNQGTGTFTYGKDA